MCAKCERFRELFTVSDDGEVIRDRDGKVVGQVWYDTGNQYGLGQGWAESSIRAGYVGSCGLRYGTREGAVNAVLKMERKHKELMAMYAAEAEAARDQPDTQYGRCHDCGRMTTVTRCGDMSGIPGWACDACLEYPSFA